MMSPLQLLTSLLRAAALLSPAAVAILTFVYLVHDADNPRNARSVDYTSTASVD
ncbi:hypothetical protein SAMN05216176_101661 [Nitratireductor indicus]|nr:hypothetical protein SAMN05216176_101661 [Nitratireductor indicus]